MVALGTLGPGPALLALLPWFSFWTPDSSDARGANGPLLTLQPFLAFLSTFTIGPWITPVPLHPIGSHRATVAFQARLSPLPNEALFPSGTQGSKVTLHPSIPWNAWFSHCTRRPLGSHVSQRTYWPLGSLRARFSREALGARWA